NSYWAGQGVPILAHVDAAAEFEERGYDILARMENYNRDKAEGTEVVLPTETFEDRHVIDLGGVRIEVLYLGPAHSPGDMAFHERLLPIFEDTDTAGWLSTWETAFETLGAVYVIPGHGHPTNMAQVRRYTRDYLVHLRARIRERIDEGGDLADAYYVDQSAYAHLHTFDELATRNAGRVYEQMEWE
ncbi:MAG: MBL fold metallo-hydrolase, partial [Pseudomonadota bacterium]